MAIVTSKPPHHYGRFFVVYYLHYTKVVNFAGPHTV